MSSIFKVVLTLVEEGSSFLLLTLSILSSSTDGNGIDGGCGGALLGQALSAGGTHGGAPEGGEPMPLPLPVSVELFDVILDDVIRLVLSLSFHVLLTSS